MNVSALERWTERATGEVESHPVEPVLVTLANGQLCDIGAFNFQELQELQWQQERRFAELLATSEQGSTHRAELFAHAYDTVTTIYGRIMNQVQNNLVMGYDPRYATLVRHLLGRRQEQQRSARLFEIGFGSGALLAEMRDAEVSGIEVSATMREQALHRLPHAQPERLFLGDFLTLDLSAAAPVDVVFWNDVLEHIVPDDGPAFFQRIHGLLAPGGYVVTITPNWHIRPSDVTRDFAPPRTEARGFHLKEYTLDEVTTLLRGAGFVNIATPLVVTHQRIVLAGSGFAACKSACEGALEWLPYRLAKLCCRALGLSCTIAQKPL